LKVNAVSGLLSFGFSASVVRLCLRTFNFYWLHSFRLVRIRLRCAHGRRGILGRLANKFLINFAIHVLAIRHRFISTLVDRCLSWRVVFKSDDKSLIGSADTTKWYRSFYQILRSISISDTDTDTSDAIDLRARYKCR